MNLDELVTKDLSDHPGYELADWYEAALPAYDLSLRINVMEAQPVPPIAEFVLRLLDADLNTSIEIAQLMGLEHSMVVGALEDLERLGYVTVATVGKGQSRRELLTITSDGRQLLRTLVINRPVEDSLNVCQDALTGGIERSRRLLPRRTVNEEERHAIPPLLLVPEKPSLDIVQLRRFWSETRRAFAKNSQEKSKELVSVEHVEKATLGYLRIRILQFVRQTDGELIIHVYDGAERSLAHEVAILRMHRDGIRDALRIEHKPKHFPTKLDDPAAELLGQTAYEAAWRKFRELPRLQKEIKTRQAKIEEEAGHDNRQQVANDDRIRTTQQIGDLRAEIEQFQDQIAELDAHTSSSEILSMAEHRPRLFEALSEAKRRVIIISPWLTPTAVNYELREAIGQCLKRDVEVWIGFGFGEPDKQEETALKKLEYLQQQPSGKRLFLHRLNDSHAKVVVCDDSYMITTSFNWLSFAGREDWGNRIEFGTLTRSPNAVQKMLQQLEPLFGTTFVAKVIATNVAPGTP